jgi:hypothetical protein
MLHDTTTHKVLRYVAHCPAFTIAELQRGKTTVLGLTWNPDGQHTSGYPNTHGKQQWFQLPEQLAALVLEHEPRLVREIGEPPSN